jgi:hypothetical protein
MCALHLAADAAREQLKPLCVRKIHYRKVAGFFSYISSRGRERGINSNHSLGDIFYSFCAALEKWRWMRRRDERFTVIDPCADRERNHVCGSSNTVSNSSIYFSSFSSRKVDKKSVRTII